MGLSLPAALLLAVLPLETAGVLILAPDLPENKDDRPFLWGENEYVVNVGASYILAANAAADLLRDRPGRPGSQ